MSMDAQNFNPGASELELTALELALREQDGETLTSVEQATLATARAASPELFAAITATAQDARQAYASAVPSANFTKNVLRALPAEAKPALAQKAALVFTTQKKSSRNWLWYAASAAAAACITLAVLRWNPNTPPVEPSKPSAMLAKGDLLDEKGQKVANLEAGKLYQVKSDEGVVLKAGNSGVLKVQKDAAFRPLAQTASAQNVSTADPGVFLDHGGLYASQKGPRPMLVQSHGFATEVAGTSYVMREDTGNLDADPFGGQGMVMVFKGTANVHPMLSEAVRLNEGQVYIAGEQPEAVGQFLEKVDTRAKDLAMADDPNPNAQRKRYKRAVEDYQSQLTHIEATLASTRVDAERTELLDRKRRVKDYLESHRRRLESLPQVSTGNETESPAHKAQRLLRAKEWIKKSQDAYEEPDTWL